MPTWTERAYTDLWLTHSNVAAVMPFILRDSSGGWNDFAWTDPVPGSRASASTDSDVSHSAALSLEESPCSTS